MQEISGRPSYWERAYLTHLLEIKKLLGEEINEEMLDALREGYPRYYVFEHYHTSKEEMPDEDMEFVISVLGMYEDLQQSYSELMDKDPDVERAISFPGFDGNARDGYLGYLSFLVKHGRYTYVKPLDKGQAINSHGPVTDMYSRMLAEYKSIKHDKYDGRTLTLDEIRTIFKAQIHPDNR